MREGWNGHLTPALRIGSADSADAEGEKRTQRLGKITRRMVHGFNALDPLDRSSG